MKKIQQLTKGMALLLALAAGAGSSAMAQAVIFPQEQQAGVATMTSGGGHYTLENDLFSADFAEQDGALRFGGCERLGLEAGTELFRIQLGNGTEVPASAMSLGEVRTVSLTGNAAAPKGSERFDGQAIEADYTYGNLDITWRAVLRDGSHYLRTELELTAKRNVAMQAIIPMIYSVNNAYGPAPKVVGNTRGAILASDHIFAGLETPMGINTVEGAAQDLSGFVYNAWTADTYSWAPGGETPAAVTALGFAQSEIAGTRGYLVFNEAGTHTVTFLYSAGTHRLNIVGVDLVDVESGKVVAQDYHIGYTGGEKSNNVYTLNVPEAKAYLVRYFTETKTETITSSGTITWSKAVSAPTLAYDLAAGESPYLDAGVLHLTTPGATSIVGRWSRNTTLQAGQTWTVSAVVGLIAEGQARRSVLCYSERERAVAWRPFPIYVSWYELNIDRNNDRTYETNMTAEQCVDVVRHWKTGFYDKYNEGIGAFVWDDGWDFYGTWGFNKNFPDGFAPIDAVARDMDSGIGAWLGPVGGYGTSGNYRREYWNSRGGMQLSNKAYYDVFYNACSSMISAYDFRFFKFDGISAQWSSVGPDAGTTGEENAEGIISMEQKLRELRPDIFFNTTVGTWASPFWFHVSDAVWRQENDYGEIGDQGSDRERWITYRDRLVYQNFVQNSPLCPINTLMTHGFILTKYGNVSKDMEYYGVQRELRAAFACGSGMVELYCDYELMNEINGGKLWQDLAECIRWQREQADVLPDIHWVGGNPWDGTNANVYGWAAWNGKKAVLTLRNPSTAQKTFRTTLREALDIPAYVTGTMTFSAAFQQGVLSGLPLGKEIDIDQALTLRVPKSSLLVFNGVQTQITPDTGIGSIEAGAGPQNADAAAAYDLLGRRINAATAKGVYIQGGRKVLR
ncbi:MAG: hypothetical protein IJ722_02580 [Alloprevotella sp.]|nr:hypothetical protein [Alloprevotella sp.]